MIFIIIISNKSTIRKQNYYLQILIVCVMKLKILMFTKTFGNDKDKFDSDYPEDSPYFNNANKKVIGKFKDEAAGINITEFIGLRSRMYSYIKDNDQNYKTAKGIKKNVIKTNIKHEDYKQTLFNNRPMYHTMKTIRSKNPGGGDTRYIPGWGGAARPLIP